MRLQLDTVLAIVRTICAITITAIWIVRCAHGT